MRRLAALAALLATLAAGATHAAERKVTAANGVVVTISGDDFEPRTDYTAPEKTTAYGGYIFAVRKIKGSPDLFLIQGTISYLGDWRFYDSAYLRGGEALKFTSLDHDTGNCRFGCTLSETFQLEFTPAQLAAALAQGDIAVKVTSRRGVGDVIFDVPAAQVRAAVEVAGDTLPTP